MYAHSWGQDLWCFRKPSQLIKDAHVYPISYFRILVIPEAIFSCDQADLWMVQSVRPSIGTYVPSLSHLFTRGQFWPSGIVIACVCVSVCVSVCVCINHLLVRTITDQPFKLESPNLDQRWKIPWRRCLLYFGGDRSWSSKSNSTWKSNFTSFWACLHDNFSPVLS